MKLYMHKLFVFLIFFYFSSNVSAQQLPKEPKTPYSPSLANETIAKKKKKVPKKKPKNPNFVRRAKIQFCNLKSVQGSLQYLPNSISFQHTVDGIAYSKQLNFDSIAAIRFLSWRGKKRKKKSQDTLYRFSPSKIEIQTYKEGSFFIKKSSGLPFYQFHLQNRNGNAYFYSIWYDSQTKDGSFTSQLKYPLLKQVNPSNCHPRVIRQITFIDKIL